MSHALRRGGGTQASARPPCRWSPVAEVAVVVEAARGAEIAAVVVAACGLTTREREVRHDIAAELFLSAHTVRDHIKSIFERVGVGSRAEHCQETFTRPS